MIQFLIDFVQNIILETEDLNVKCFRSKQKSREKFTVPLCCIAAFAIDLIFLLKVHWCLKKITQRAYFERTWRSVHGVVARIPVIVQPIRQPRWPRWGQGWSHRIISWVHGFINRLSHVSQRSWPVVGWKLRRCSKSWPRDWPRWGLRPWIWSWPRASPSSIVFL